MATEINKNLHGNINTAKKHESPARRRRHIAARVGVASVVSALGFGLYEGHSAKTSSDNEQSKSYLVRPGDTIWMIADRISENTDPREEVYKIEQHVDINAEHPNTSVVQPGDKLIYSQGGKVINFVERSSK